MQLINMPTTYNFHNLIRIKITDDANPGIINALDFQIGHFKGRNGNFQKEILIKSFEDFKTDKTFIHFHLVKGIKGEIYFDDNNKFAINRTPNGFVIYTADSFLINIFIQLILVELGYSFIHAAAAIDGNGKCLLLPGPGGVGKTAILGKLIDEENFRLLGDDVVAIGKDGECLSLPRSFVLKDYHSETYPELFKKLNLNSKRKKIIPQITKFLNENAPFAGLIKKYLKQSGHYRQAIRALPLPKDYAAAIPVKDIFGDKKIADRGIINEIIFLERYDGKEFVLDDMTENSLSNRLLAIIHHEWASYQKLLLSLASLEILNLSEYYQSVNDIIRKSIRQKNPKILSIPDSASPLELWENFNKILIK